MYRNPVSKDKIFVEVRLHEGPPRIFLIDTGSSLSVVSRDVALELGLKLQPRSSTLVGVAGRTGWIAATLPEVRLGRFLLTDQEVAVGVKGIPSHVGLVPMDGVLGNDVLRHFQVEVDYPGQTLRLSRPGEQAHPEHAVPLYFDGQHPKAQVRITARNSAGHTVDQSALLDVDTGATSLLLMGPSTRGLEAVSVPTATRLQGVGSTSPIDIEARDLSIVSAELGGRRVDGSFQAQWIGAEQPPHRAAERMPGLLGHQILKGHRVFIDYPAKRFALTESTGSIPE
jgi:predicted aspartyl protease